MGGSASSVLNLPNLRNLCNLRILKSNLRLEAQLLVREIKEKQK
jgi:hypothetical protein